MEKNIFQNNLDVNDIPKIKRLIINSREFSSRSSRAIKSNKFKKITDQQTDREKLIFECKLETRRQAAIEAMLLQEKRRLASQTDNLKKEIYVEKNTQIPVRITPQDICNYIGRMKIDQFSNTKITYQSLAQQYESFRQQQKLKKMERINSALEEQKLEERKMTIPSKYESKDNGIKAENIPVCSKNIPRKTSNDQPIIQYSIEELKSMNYIPVNKINYTTF